MTTRHGSLATCFSPPVTCYTTPDYPVGWWVSSKPTGLKDAGSKLAMCGFFSDRQSGRHLM